MLKRFPIITLQIPCEIVSGFDERVVAVVPERADASWACRWCYGRPMPGYDVCSRIVCIQAVESVNKLYSVTRGWEDQ